MGEIVIGTSGFYYDDWKGAFYPDALPAAEFLSYYAGRFKALELNFSYYKIPEARQSGQMVEKADGRLKFTIKASRQLTHEISDRSLKEVLPLFIRGISPFVEEGCLGAVLLQFPQSFHYSAENRFYLRSLIHAMSPLPLAVEFRQKEWLRDSVFRALEDMQAAFVCVDEPFLPSLIPPTVISTSGAAYIRFHGRNRKTWYGTDSRARYDYLYSEDELKEWLPKILSLAGKTEKMYVFFNNHAKAQAVTNARMLINLLDIEQ